MGVETYLTIPKYFIICIGSLILTGCQSIHHQWDYPFQSLCSPSLHKQIFRILLYNCVCACCGRYHTIVIYISLQQWNTCQFSRYDCQILEGQRVINKLQLCRNWIFILTSVSLCRINNNINALKHCVILAELLVKLKLLLLQRVENKMLYPHLKEWNTK